MKDHLLQTTRVEPIERRANLAREYLQIYLLRVLHEVGATADLAFVGGNWRRAVMGRLDALDWKAVLADLRPFVERQADLDMLSKEAVRKLLERA